MHTALWDGQESSPANVSYGAMKKEKETILQAEGTAFQRSDTKRERGCVVSGEREAKFGSK